MLYYMTHPNKQDLTEFADLFFIFLPQNVIIIKIMFAMILISRPQAAISLNKDMNQPRQDTDTNCFHTKTQTCLDPCESSSSGKTCLIKFLQRATVSSVDSVFVVFKSWSTQTVQKTIFNIFLNCM